MTTVISRWRRISLRMLRRWILVVVPILLDALKVKPGPRGYSATFPRRRGDRKSRNRKRTAAV